MTPTPNDDGFLGRLYDLRWPLTLVALGGVVLSLVLGTSRIGALGSAVAGLGDTTPGIGAPPPTVFDPRMSNWFGAEDEAVRSYNAIEDRFVAEDFVMLTFENPGAELGVFAPEALDMVARLTAALERIPGVRHVRSLTSNPWIRWAEIEAGESGLVISDLVEGDPLELGEAELIERFVAVLGAERAAARLGEERVRSVLGPDVALSDFIGEPRLLGTIVSEDASTSAIQVQVLRPIADPELAAAALEADAVLGEVAPDLFSIQAQRAALRGIEHCLRVESGRSVPSPEGEALVARVAALPEGEEKLEWQTRLADPTRAFVPGFEGAPVRKWFDYDPDGEGGWVDSSDPSHPVVAPKGFSPVPRSPFEFHLGGVPLFELNFEEVGMSDAKYMGLMFLIIAVLLAVVFRNVSGVLTPMAVVFGSVGAMVGIAFSLGFLFNNLTMISPNMLTAVGIADAIHLVASWLVIRGGVDSRREAILETLRRNALPVLLTSITTAIGFFSLTVSGLAPVRMLGVMAGLGALVAFVLSMTLVPAMLSLVPHRPGKGSRPAMAGIFTPERSRRWVGVIGRRQGGILLGTGVLAVVGLIGLARVRIDTDFRAMFPEDNEVMGDFGWIEDRMGGVGDLEIVFDGHRGAPPVEGLDREARARLEELHLRSVGAAEFDELRALDGEERAELQGLEVREEAARAAGIGIDAAFLGALDRFEARLRGEMAEAGSDMAVITDLSSPLDVLRKIHQVQNENAAEAYRTPTEADVPASQRVASLEYDEWTEEWSMTPAQSGSSLVAQYYLQYENGAKPGENLGTELSPDRTQFRMQGRVEQAPSDVQSAAFARIEEIAREEFPELGARVDGEVPEGARSAMTVSGKTLLFARTTKVFALGFIESMSIALLLITVLIGVIFRSWKLALTSMAPNVLPIILPLSVFGLIGVPLDGPAILVSSVALGVCVDDTIHVFTKYVRARRRGHSTDEALVHVFEQAGAAVSLTTIVLVVGFSTLLLSDFSPNFMMGSLASAMIALAWVGDMLVVPALLRWIDRAPTASTPVPSPAAA